MKPILSLAIREGPLLTDPVQVLFALGCAADEVLQGGLLWWV